MTAAIELAGLGRTYQLSSGPVAALRDLHLTVPAGQVVGLLGHNGAGKTTLTKILSTLLLPTSGSARIFGYDVARDVRQVRRLTGVVFGGDQGFYPRLSGRDNVRFFAALNGLPGRGADKRVEQVIADVGMTDAADRSVGTYSKGMYQRMHIAVGMATRPPLLLLDEPSIGLDPVEAERLRATVRQLRKGGTTVILTTHNLIDIERLADRVLLLAGGRLVSDTDVPTFARMAGHVAVITVHGAGRLPYGPASADIRHEEDDRWTLVWHVPEWSARAFTDIAHLLGGTGTEIHRVDVAPARLEDAYLEAGRA